MKNLLTAVLLLLGSYTATAQCSPKAILHCDTTITVNDDVELLPDGSYPGVAYIEFTAGQGLVPPTSTWINTPPQGQPLVYTTPTSISPSFGQYAVTVYYYPSQTNVLTNSKICTSTTIMNSVWDSVTNGYIGAPAQPGYQYQNGVPVQFVTACTTQSSAVFLVKKKGRGRNR